jgi:hypothetical protein
MWALLCLSQYLNKFFTSITIRVDLDFNCNTRKILKENLLRKERPYSHLLNLGRKQSTS